MFVHVKLHITHLFKNRLNVPHAIWDKTSQKGLPSTDRNNKATLLLTGILTFLSNHNRNAYEQEMKQITE